MADPVTLSMALTAGATAMQAISTIAGGNAQDKASRFEAAQLTQQAGESRAGAQRAALEHRRNTRLAQSTLQARAAASGGGATDPGVLDLSADIAERGEYQSLMEMYRGENRARGLEDQAAATRAGGKWAKKAAIFDAVGTIIGGASSMAGRYKPQSISPTPAGNDPIDLLRYRRNVSYG